MHDARARHGCKVLRPDFRKDDSGIALVYVTISLPLIIGFALLAVDVGRFMSLNSSLQHGADALALAGAAELDGRPDAVTRSDSAMNLLVTQNTAVFTSSAATINFKDIDRCYLSSIPSDDAQAIDPKNCLPTDTPANLASSSSAARFVWVTVKPKNYSTIFPATFLGALTDNASTNAGAVAGFQAAACNFTPMFICNPYEPATAKVDDPANVRNPYDIYSYVTKRADRRRQISLKSQSKQWAPGNFGFLAASSGKNGASSLVEQILKDTPDACFLLSNVNLDTQPGNIDSLSSAFNVRFDLYEKNNLPGGYNPKNYDPAPNVRKGYVPLVTVTPGKGKSPPTTTTDYCTQTPDVSPYSQARGFGLDACFTSGTSCFAKDGAVNTSIGGGDWDFEDYWKFNFGTLQAPKDETGKAFSNTNRPSRYEVYKYEIDNKLTGKPPAGVEYGAPMCKSAASSLGADRRILYAAIINCRAANINGKTTGLQAVAFGKFFLTNPVSLESDPDKILGNFKATVRAELVDVVRPGDGTGIARDMVQLYR